MGKGIGIDMGMLHYLPPHPLPPFQEERGVGSREVISKVWKFGSLEFEVWNLSRENLEVWKFVNSKPVEVWNFQTLEVWNREVWKFGNPEVL